MVPGGGSGLGRGAAGLPRARHHREPLHHRQVKIPDLLIAAVAARHDVVLVHYDADYDVIAGITGQRMRWAAPARVALGNSRVDGAGRRAHARLGQVGSDSFGVSKSLGTSISTVSPTTRFGQRYSGRGGGPARTAPSSANWPSWQAHLNRSPSSDQS